ncbi:MAG: chromosome segregation protein SMC [Planctomycetes bacterium]|nr:chromosome segregation protein SMC [Planctomycetota bacterium]
MKLTKVEMYGFKSFAQRTEFQIGDGITAVVGPNGCGKSNLVDAIQWALGETRPTRLRSSGMADVVYRGDSASVDGAEVSLTFDNADQRLPCPTAEVRVTRKLSKDGDGEYRINDAPAKLKEIKDLFLDTGLGVGGYSFMAQGQIDAILRASPAERRVLLEEAAGTSRYRVRRKEAVRRLDRTDQDLARANDLLVELERQVRSLKVQAGRARTWVEKRDRLRCVLAVLLARRRRELNAILAEIEARKAAALAALDSGRAELGLAEAAHSTREDEQAALSAAISDLRTTLADRRARSEHLAARMAELGERSGANALEREEGGARRSELHDQIEELDRAARDAEARVAEVMEQEHDRREEKVLAQRRVQELLRQAQELERELIELERDELDLVESEQRARSALADVESHWKALSSSRRKLEERSAERSRAIADTATTVRALQRKVDGLTGDRTALEAELSADDDVLARFYSERQVLSDRLRHREAKVEGEKSKLAVVEEAIARHEGVSEVVRGLLDRAAEGDPELAGIEGIVADLVTAPTDTARALEAALGPLSEALVVRDRATADRLLKVLRREGLERIRILSRAEIGARASEGGSPLMWNELLRQSSFDAKDGELLAALLSRFDLLPADVPMTLCSPVEGRALVSADGEVMLSSFESISRGRGEFLGLITRRNERERLKAAVARGEAECTGWRAELDLKQEEIALRERDREVRARRRAEASQLEGMAQKELQTGASRLELLREELGLDARELVDLERRSIALKSDARELKARREALERKRLDARAERAQVAETLHGGADERRAAEEIAATLDVEVAKLAERAKAAHEAREAARQRVRERHEELKRADRRLVELGEEEVRLAEAQAQAAAERARVQEEIDTQQQELAARQGELERHRAASAELRRRVHDLRGVVEAASRDAQSCELREQEQRLHGSMLEQKVREELLIEPDALVAQMERVEEGRGTTVLLPAPPPLEPAAPVDAAAAAAPVQQSGDGVAAPALPPAVAPAPIEVVIDLNLFHEPLPVLETEADKLRGTLARLGPVNVVAIEELQAVEGRSTFLQKQKQDLGEAKLRLRQMIEEIDRECETRFSATYDAVREHFKALFRRLFGGGRADLTLVETEDPAEMGVEIIAAPPGKDPRSIAMLSGGERTLTAAALLFGLFSTRPSPICVLDEVDAALDEANVERFGLMVKDFLGRTQFLIVTHHKRTMAIADTLYGVTMEGNGISRPIAMRFDQGQTRSHAATA